MRGKSIDTEFVATFIQDCAQNSKNLPEEICKEALDKIEEIDKQLKLRFKLVDVLSFFNYKKKSASLEIEDDYIINKTIADLLLSFVPFECTSNSIIQKVSDGQDLNYKKNVIFTFKQLLKNKIISKYNDIVIFGDNYKEYAADKV